VADYSSEIATALSLIKEYGTAVTIAFKNEDRVYDPITDTATGATWIEENGYAVLTNYKEDFIDGELIQRGDKVMLIPASGLTNRLKQGDRILENAIEWTAVNVREIAPDGTVIIYKAQVRR